tara:strand:- start:194 stop:568 length:375 start_codon:yes stop_codon:yes gene_type:complete
MKISDTPLLAAEDKATLNEKVSAYISAAKLRAADGITISEVCELIVSAMRLAIDAVDELTVEGSEKKTIVLDLVAVLFDQFADMVIPLPAKPVWYLLKPAAKSLALTLASGAVEALLPIVRGNK